MNQQVDQRHAQRMTAAATNTDLLRRAIEGDLGSWEASVEQHSRYLRRVAYSYGLDHHLVDLIVRTTWLKLIKHAHSAHHPQLPTEWLRTTFERKFLHMIHHRNHQRPPGDSSTRLDAAYDTPAPGGNLPRSAALTELRQALGTLSARERRLLLQLASADGRSSHKLFHHERFASNFIKHHEFLGRSNNA